MRRIAQNFWMQGLKEYQGQCCQLHTRSTFFQSSSPVEPLRSPVARPDSPLYHTRYASHPESTIYDDVADVSKQAPRYWTSKELSLLFLSQTWCSFKGHTNCSFIVILSSFFFFFFLLFFHVIFYFMQNRHLKDALSEANIFVTCCFRNTFSVHSLSLRIKRTIFFALLQLCWHCYSFYWCCLLSHCMSFCMSFCTL